MDDNSVRAVNIITRPDHDIWKITNGKDMRAWFQKAFPRFRFTKDGDGHGDGELISMEEWNRFAEAQGTRFPPCQYSPGLQATPGDGECGVVLVGDAIHAFPPDIGQGINSGLEDVCALDTALKGGDGSNMNANKSLGSRLQDYEKNRLPEVKALIRLARFGFPYQYRQSWRIDRIRAKLVLFNLLLRLALNKLSFGLIPKPSVMLMQDPDLKFSQVMRRADTTTVGLTLAFCLSFFHMLKRWVSIV